MKTRKKRGIQRERISGFFMPARAALDIVKSPDEKEDLLRRR